MARLKLETIDPATAAEWMKLYFSLQGDHPEGIHDYREELRGGRWNAEQTRTDPIIFDTEGRRRSGNSRLRAVVETGIPIKCWVARDVDHQPKRGHLWLADQLKNAIIEK
jgi:hypothetical protein